jgi:hypothetical protein
MSTKASSKAGGYSRKWRAPSSGRKKKNRGPLRLKGYGNYRWRKGRKK